ADGVSYTSCPQYRMITVGATTPGRLRPHSPSMTAPETSTPYIITGTPARPGITITGSFSARAGAAGASRAGARPPASRTNLRLRSPPIGAQLTSIARHLEQERETAVRLVKDIGEQH